MELKANAATFMIALLKIQTDVFKQMLADLNFYNDCFPPDKLPTMWKELQDLAKLFWNENEIKMKFLIEASLWNNFSFSIIFFSIGPPSAKIVPSPLHIVYSHIKQPVRDVNVFFLFLFLDYYSKIVNMFF